MKGIRRYLFPALLVLLSFGTLRVPAATAADRWLLMPGVNCRLEDFRAVFGPAQLVAGPIPFDGRWTAKEGEAEAKAETNGLLSCRSKGELWQPAQARAAVVWNYSAKNGEPMNVGLAADYQIVTGLPVALPSPEGEGGSYARVVFWLKVTDTNNGKTYQKWFFNHGACAIGPGSLDNPQADKNVLTFTLEPGHNYRIEAVAETIAAVYCDPGGDETGTASAELVVNVNRLNLTPKNPPWISVWSTYFVPRTFDTYDRYERWLQGARGQGYFPAEFNLGFSAGGDYSPAESYVSVDCGAAMPAEVSSFPNYQLGPHRVTLKLPAGGGRWTVKINLDAEVDPVKVPVLPLPAPLVEFFMTNTPVKPDPLVGLQFDPENYSIKIGENMFRFKDWGKGPVVRIIQEQHGGGPRLDWETIYYRNPRTGETISLKDLARRLGIAKSSRLVLSGQPPTEKEISLAIEHRIVIYQEAQSLRLKARVANGPDFTTEETAEVKYTGVFDFLPRPQSAFLDAWEGMGEL